MGSNVGSNWSEVVGDWGIEGFQLVEKYGTSEGTSSAKIICTQQQPAHNAGEQWLSVDVCDPQTGDKYYLYPCAPSTGAVGMAIEFECTDAPANWTVRAGSVEHEFVVTTDGFNCVRIGACVDGNYEMLKAWVLYSPLIGGDDEGPLWDDSATGIGNGRYSGVGHNNTEHINTFDNYAVGELRLEDGTICNECFCRCLDKPLPRTLNLAVIEASGRMSCFGGYECTLIWEYNSGNDRWRGEFTVVNGSKTATFEWCLYCEGGEDSTDEENPGKNISLTLCNLAGSCCTEWPDGCRTVWVPIAGSTCEPLELEFADMDTSLNDLECQICYDYPDGPTEGYIKVMVTE
jgi:hypothetical protein